MNKSEVDTKRKRIASIGKSIAKLVTEEQLLNREIQEFENSCLSHLWSVRKYDPAKDHFSRTCSKCGKTIFADK